MKFIEVQFVVEITKYLVLHKSSWDWVLILLYTLAKTFQVFFNEWYIDLERSTCTKKISKILFGTVRRDDDDDTADGPSSDGCVEVLQSGLRRPGGGIGVGVISNLVEAVAYAAPGTGATGNALRS